MQTGFLGHRCSLRMVQRILVAVAILGIAFALEACGTSGGAAAPPPQATLRSIAVSPLNPSIPVDGTQQLVATGSYSNGTSKDLTTQATWTSSSAIVASVNASGLATGITSGSTTITASFAQVSGSENLSVTPILESITVTPAAPSLLVNTTQQLSATGMLSNGSSQDLTAQVAWASSNSSVASVDGAGLATSVAAGTATITATKGAIAGSTSISVTAPTLSSIVLSPDQSSAPQGVTQVFVATGLFSGGDSVELASVTWTSSNPALVSIDGSGSAATLGVGTVTISATSGAVVGSTTFTVLPPTPVAISVNPSAPSLALGTTVQLSAVEEFTDGSTQNLLAPTWTSSDVNIAAVDSTGLVSTAAPGTVTVSAAAGGISGSTVVTVSNAVATSITVTPPNPSVPAGTAQQFTATATFSDATLQDVTNTVTWISSAGDVASVSNSGLATALATGSSSITASSGSISGSTSLQVTAAVLQSVSVAPQNLMLAIGTTAQLTATGVYSDSSTQDLTQQAVWSSSVGGVASVSTIGLVTARKAGAATITAVSGGVSGSTLATVVTHTLQSIVVTPVNPATGRGQTLQFTATGHYDDGSTQDITTSVHWSTSSANLATINSGQGGGGLASGKGSGNVTITAALNGISGSTTLTVN